MDDITQYQFTTSTFDLVAVSTFKIVVLVILITEVEKFTIARLYQADVRPVMHIVRYACMTLLFIISLGSLAFSIVKLVFVLEKRKMLKLGIASVYIFLIISVFEFVGIILVGPSLSRLKLIEQPVSTNAKKKVDLKRLMSLSREERPLLFSATVFLFLSSATQIFQPYFFGKIVDQAIKNEPMKEITINVAILFSINVFGAITSCFRSWLFELSGQ